MDNCPQCGANYALVGRIHNCRPRHRAELAVAESTPAAPSGTYKYRDKQKRQVQVAAAMRAYRARKRAGGGVKNTVPNSA